MFPITRTTCLTALALMGSLIPDLVAAEEPNGQAAVGSTLYHRDQNHLWNRVHAALLIRTGPDGKEYGQDRLEPLLWSNSDYLLTGKSFERAIAVLDEFLRDKGESLIEDPLQHAILQRDLWLIANWAADSREIGAKKLLERLALVIQRLALTAEQIGKLPDNYAQAVSSQRFADRFDSEKPQGGYLPPHLFQADGPWVCVGRSDGLTAPRHLQTGNPFANSTFLIFLKLPTGREATLDFLKKLAAFDKPLYVANTDAPTIRSYQNLPNPALPQWPKGTEVALVRRAMLIDSRGGVVASPITESVQIRVTRDDTPELTAKMLTELESGLGGEVVNGTNPPTPPSRAMNAQAFAEFQLRRADLFAGQAGGLHDVSAERDFKTGFNAHGWDAFDGNDRPADPTRPFPERSQPFKNNRASCLGCHRFPGVYSFNSFHGMFPFVLQRRLSRDGGDDEGYVPKSDALAALTIGQVEQAAMKWKVEQAGWQALRSALRE